MHSAQFTEITLVVTVNLVGRVLHLWKWGKITEQRNSRIAENIRLYRIYKQNLLISIIDGHQPSKRHHNQNHLMWSKHTQTDRLKLISCVFYGFLWRVRMFHRPNLPAAVKCRGSVWLTSSIVEIITGHLFWAFTDTRHAGTGYWTALPQVCSSALKTGESGLIPSPETGNRRYLSVIAQHGVQQNKPEIKHNKVNSIFFSPWQLCFFQSKEIGSLQSTQSSCTNTVIHCNMTTCKNECWQHLLLSDFFYICVSMFVMLGPVLSHFLPMYPTLYHGCVFPWQFLENTQEAHVCLKSRHHYECLSKMAVKKSEWSWT